MLSQSDVKRKNWLANWDEAHRITPFSCEVRQLCHNSQKIHLKKMYYKDTYK